MKRQVSYQWRLRAPMAAHGMFSTTELVPLLWERGIDLSVSQVHRLATGTPERLSLAVLAALCDIFECTPAELIATKAENASGRKTATDDAVIDPAAITPKHAPAPSVMSPASTTREQFERWHIRACIRCGRRAAKAANWEDPICRTCFDHAVHTWGRGPACGTPRLLPGRRSAEDAVPMCRGCAAITRDFFYNRCGFEDCLLGGRLCERCTFADKLTQTLDEGTGQTRPELGPLLNGVLTTTEPKRELSWFAQSQGPGLLSALARGELPLTHEALAQHPNWPTASCGRELLMHYGVLPHMASTSCSSNAGWPSAWPTSKTLSTPSSSTASPPGASYDGCDEKPGTGPCATRLRTGPPARQPNRRLPDLGGMS